LEALLIFHARPEAGLSVSDVARALYVQPQTADDLIGALRLAGLLTVCEPGDIYRYAPVDDDVARLVDRLASTYADDLIGITHLIHGTTRKAAQSFADAFRIRKD
jgi:hypothetical protein